MNDEPVAEITPVRALRPQYFSRADLLALVVDHQADPGLTRKLDELAGDATEDLDDV